MSELTTPFAPLNYFLENFNLLGLFLILLIEEAGVPLPVPGDIFIFIAGVQARVGKLDFFQIVGVVTVATVIGASILYFLSKTLARPVVIKLARFAKADEVKLKKVSNWFVARGGTAVVVSRLTPGLRTVTSIAAGILAFPYRIFAPYTTIAAVFWATLYFLLGFYLGPGAISVLQIIGRYFVIFVIVVLFLGLLGYFYLRRKRFFN